MENKKDLSEVSLSEIVQSISNILKENKLTYIAILILCILGSAGILVKEKLNQEYKAQILIGSDVLNLPNLQIIIEDINLEIEQSDAMQRFNLNPDVYQNIDDLTFGRFSIKAADDKDKSLNAYRLEFIFSEPVENLNFAEISEVVLNDIKNKGSVNVAIQQSKAEILKNIESINNSIAKAQETETAIRKSFVDNNQNLGVIGISELYTELNNLKASKNRMEKELFFFQKENLVYKLTNHSFENNGLSKIELIAYTLFLFLFLSLLFTIYKLIMD